MIERTVKKLLLVLFVTVSFSAAAFGTSTLLWKVDFENGFTATSGTPQINLGNISNPNDANNQVCVIYDANLGSHVLRVGKVGAGLNRAARLSYIIDPNFLGKDGRITLKFSVSHDPNYNNNYSVFFMASTNTGGTYQNYWCLPLGNVRLPLIWTRQLTADPENYYTGTYCPPAGAGAIYPPPAPEDLSNPPWPPVSSLTPGWHTLDFIWARRTAGDPNIWGNPRERADLRLSIDNDPNMTWEYRNFPWSISKEGYKYIRI